MIKTHIHLPKNKNCFIYVHNQDEIGIERIARNIALHNGATETLSRSFLKPQFTVSQNINVLSTIYGVSKENIEDLEIIQNIKDMTKSEMPHEVWFAISLILFSYFSKKDRVFTTFCNDFNAQYKDVLFLSIISEIKKLIDKKLVNYFAIKKEPGKLMHFDQYIILVNNGDIECFDDRESFVKAQNLIHSYD
tara:strand:+ start:248 stop:823 length:576 start_codon:yes stop_codon:yes gene_type:complete